jgi:hypothetical protein
MLNHHAVYASCLKCLQLVAQIRDSRWEVTRIACEFRKKLARMWFESHDSRIDSETSGSIPHHIQQGLMS